MLDFNQAEFTSYPEGNGNCFEMMLKIKTGMKIDFGYGLKFEDIHQRLEIHMRRQVYGSLIDDIENIRYSHLKDIPYGTTTWDEVDQKFREILTKLKGVVE